MIFTFRTIRSSLALVLAVGIAACGDQTGTGNGNGNGTGPVATVVVTPGGRTLRAIGATLQLTATAQDASDNTISGKTFTWASDAENIATVNSSGLVTAMANGSATVTATTDEIDGTAAISVDDTPITLVTVRDNFFDPGDVTVASGVTVTWDWFGVNPHNVTFDDGIGNSGTQSSGEHTRRFDQTGTFGYHCSIHGAAIMSGMVVVQ